MCTCRVAYSYSQGYACRLLYMCTVVHTYHTCLDLVDLSSLVSYPPEKYPEIKKLMGPDPHFKYIVSAMVIFNIVSCYFIGKLPYLWVVVISYCLGGIINHSLTLAIHDISHNVVFGNKYPTANRLFGIWANLPIGVPMSISFKKYHVEHHRYQGTDGYDTDLATEWEGRFFHSTATKILWLFLQPLFYAFRPFCVRPKPLLKLELLNIVVQVVFDILIVYFFGFKSLLYLIVGTLLCMGLHPMSAHFIAEHYMFDRGYETYSYYGPWNYITFNVGYHMEHHDFPYIPGSRLPEVKRIAAEFYDNLPAHTSWLSVLRIFLFSPRMGPYARVKRRYKDVFGEDRDKNPYLYADNTLHPVLPKEGVIDKSSRMKESLEKSLRTKERFEEDEEDWEEGPEKVVQRDASGCLADDGVRLRTPANVNTVT